MISAIVGLVCINLQPEYELFSSTRFGQFQKFGKVGIGGTVFPSHPKEKISAWGSEFLFVATCVSDLTFLALLTLGIKEVSPNTGPVTLITGVTPEGPE